MAIISTDPMTGFAYLSLACYLLVVLKCFLCGKALGRSGYYEFNTGRSVFLPCLLNGRHALQSTSEVHIGTLKIVREIGDHITFSHQDLAPFHSE
jgi:hypothetical protein